MTSSGRRIDLSSANAMAAASSSSTVRTHFKLGSYDEEGGDIKGGCCCLEEGGDDDDGDGVRIEAAEAANAEPTRSMFSFVKKKRLKECTNDIK